MLESNQIQTPLKKLLQEYALGDEKINKLQSFGEILQDWNQKINLIAPSTEKELWERHLYDSLVLLHLQHLPQLLKASRWADLGSGAGLPAIPLAIALEQIEVHPVERVGKKSAFQTFCKAHLKIPNLHPRNLRYEELAKEGERFGVITSRALDQISNLLTQSRDLLTPQGYILLWKGKNWKEEEAQVPASIKAEFSLLEQYSYGKGRGELLLYQFTRN